MTADDEESARIETICRLLGSQRRLYVLKCLQTYPTPMKLDDLAREVAISEHGTSLDQIPAESIDHVYTTLHHVHLPKLADANVVAYDRTRHLVEPAADIETLGSVLDVLFDDDRSF